MKQRFVLVSKPTLKKTLERRGAPSRAVYLKSFDSTRGTGLTVEWTESIDEAHTFESERQAWDKAYYICGISYAMNNHAVLSDWVRTDTTKEA